MSEIILTHIQRIDTGHPNGIVLFDGIHIYMKKLETREASTYKGADPHWTYHMETFELPMIDPQVLLVRDVITDLQNIDPFTNQLRKFHIISDPEHNTFLHSWKWVATRERGT